MSQELSGPTVPSSAGTASLAIGTTIGAYVIEAEIGAGSMGNVYRARHHRLGRHVALKVLRPELLENQELIERFVQEGRSVNQIDHEHIVQVFDHVEEHEPRRVYCVMELLHGESLTQRLERAPVSHENVRAIGRQIASALGASHAAGVVHRDLKPDNIFLVQREGAEDWVKVLDFGIAKCVQQPSGPGSLIHTAQGVLLGTPRYMAPEQIAGLDVDARTDIYALGNILYELVAGQPPFDGASFGQLAAAIIKDPLPPLPQTVPPRLAALIDACLEKRPIDRPASMAVVEALLHAEAPVLLTLLRPNPRTSGLGLLALALAGVLMLMAALWPSSAPASAPEPTPRPGPTPMEVTVTGRAEVTLWVETQPPGALVSRADSGDALGRTPLEVKLPRSTQTAQLRIELPGYAPLDRSVSNATDQRLELSLQPLAKSAARRPPSRLTDGVVDPY
jgi:serine/threonine protein kinase